MSIADDLAAGLFGPVVVGGRDRRRGGLDWRHIGVYTTAFVGVLVLTASATLGTLVYAGYGQIEKVEAQGLVQPGAPAPPAAQAPGEAVVLDEVEGTTTILLVGRDTRLGLTEQQLLQLGTEDDGSDLTDTVMLVRLDPGQDEARLLSFPRDLLVDRCDGSQNRINTAYAHGQSLPAVGGPGCLVQTVNQLTGVAINHYVEVDLAGFISSVDAIGGVSFYLDEPLVDRYAGLDVPAGCVTFSGTRALGFVRARRLDSDLGRIARQQRFLREMLREATALETLANPTELVPLARAIGQSLKTDNEMGLQQIAELAYSFRDLSQEGLETFTLPTVDAVWGNAQVQALVEDQAQVVIARFMSGEEDAPAPTPEPDLFAEPSPTPTPSPTPIALNAADVPPIAVLNGAGVSGLATAGSEALTARGYVVASAGNADSFDNAATVIRHPAELAEEAGVLLADLPGSRLQVEPGADVITVVLGSDLDLTELPAPPELPLTPGRELREAQQQEEEPVESGLGTVDAEGLAAPSPSPSAPVPPAEPPTYAGAEPSFIDC